MTGGEERKIGILADAAKYDASCSTAGSCRLNSPGGMGTGAVGGICHSWSDDGRCVALLKVLFSNACVYDCAYCRNRKSSNVERASFTVDELVRVAMEFYKRNYIEGLFLSSGVIGDPDTTMRKLIDIAKILRCREGFNGYIHMKVIPGSSTELAIEAGRWVDRLSVNIELPSSASLALLAPDKKPQGIFAPMKALAKATADYKAFGPSALPDSPSRGISWDQGVKSIGTTSGEIIAKGDSSSREIGARKGTGYFLPAGQTTQMIVGASPDSDLTILGLAERLYKSYGLRRVYYSAFVPISEDSRLPVVSAPPLLREHRLYQADWLFRFYKFTSAEILDESKPNLDPSIDPKAAWALRHMEFFPVEVNRADYESLLRVPGIGPISAKRIIRARRTANLTEAGLKALGVVMKRARWFLSASGKFLGRMNAGPDSLRYHLIDDPGLNQLQFDWGDQDALAKAESPALPPTLLAAEASIPYGGYIE